MRSSLVARLVALAGVCAVAPVAQATWSIILIDTRTREVGIASATCLTGFDLRQGSPVVVTGVGAAAAQSFVESTMVTRTYIRDRLLEGQAPADIIAGLPSVDPNHQRRQYGIADVFGRGTTFTGSFAGAWAGGVSGQFSYTHADRTGTMAYAIQGNVLTGEAVITSALLAAQSTPGDLPARLMAAMQAARAQGGDGRCSCDPESPTSCGAPPAIFTTSAQIGYVIVARLGDTDRCGGVYPSAVNAPIATGNVLGTPLADMAGALPAGTLLRYENTSDRRIALPAFTRGAPTFAPSLATTVGGVPAALALSNLTGDALAEAVVGSASAVTLIAVPGGPPAPVSSFGGAAATRDVIVNDFDRDGQRDVIALNAGGVLRFHRQNGGTFSEVASLTLGQQPTDMTVCDVDADGDDDIAVALAPASQVIIIENRTPVGGAADFFVRPALTLAGPARNITSGDFDGDNDDDLAVTLNSAGNTFQIISNTAGTFTVRTAAAARVPPACVAAGDVTGDGIDDLLIGGTGGLATHRGVAGSAAGVTFSGGSALRVGGAVGGPGALEVFDADGDGDNDVLSRDGSGPLTVLENRGAPTGQPFGVAGTWVTTAGCAEGDYFLALNVSNVPGNAPDVVPILQTQFDAWRASLTGKVDGVQSVVTIPRLSTAIGPRDMLITLRDWQGGVVAAPATLEITSTAPSGAFTIGPVEPVEPGTYRATITPGAAASSGELQIRVRVGTDRPVVLMPLPTIVVGASCDGIDFNGNEVFPEEQDVIDFLAVLSGEECGTCNDIDFNNNGVFPEEQDIIDFFLALAGQPC